VTFQAFKSHFEEFKVFSVQDILKWNSAFDSRRLVEWQDKGYIKKIVNRWYMFSNQKRSLQLDFLVANRIYSPSYISFHSAWAFYGLIPEGVYAITSAASLKTNTFNTDVGTFTYRHIKPSLMFGYRLVEVEGSHQCKIAEPEKLLLDHLYLHAELKSIEDFESIRLNQTLLKEKINPTKLAGYLSLFNNRALEKRVKAFIKTYRL
jgi:predicted transcriptional regulator of viral defense system